MTTRGKNWGDTKGTSFGNEPWDKKVEWFQFPSGEEVRVRLVGPVYIVGRHWPTLLTKSVPGQKPKVYPTWCTKFDSVTEDLNPERVCALCDDFDAYVERLAVCNVIVRKFQEGRNRRGNPVVPVIWRHSDVDKVFRKAFEKFKADPADAKKGCDFSVEFDPNNKKNRWTIQREDQTPLTDEEKSYELVDFESLIPDYADSDLMAEHARDMKKSIARSGYYVIPLKNGEDGWNAYKTDVNGKPYTSFADLVAYKEGKVIASGSSARTSDDDDMPAPRRSRSDPDEEDADVSPPVKAAPPKPAPKPVAAPVADDDEEEEAPPPPPKARVVAKPAPVVVDDEDSSSEEEEEPAPKPVAKVVAKPAASPSPAAKPAAKGTPAEAWTSKFNITWVEKDGATVPECFGEYAGAKKCMSCPESNGCLDSSDS